VENARNGQTGSLGGEGEVLEDYGPYLCWEPLVEHGGLKETGLIVPDRPDRSVTSITFSHRNAQYFQCSSSRKDIWLRNVNRLLTTFRILLMIAGVPVSEN
jgi:hypothetical protein